MFIVFNRFSLIEAVMDIVLEIAVGRRLRQNLLDDMLMVFEDFVEGVGTEVVVRHQVDELTEGESTQVIRLDDSVQFWILILEPHHT